MPVHDSDDNRDAGRGREDETGAPEHVEVGPDGGYVQGQLHGQGVRVERSAFLQRFQQPPAGAGGWGVVGRQLPAGAREVLVIAGLALRP